LIIEQENILFVLVFMNYSLKKSFEITELYRRKIYLEKSIFEFTVQLNSWKLTIGYFFMS